MRIGLILYGGLENQSGGYLYDRMVVMELRRLGHEVVVLPLPGGPYLGRLCQGLAMVRFTRQLLAWRFDLIFQDELCHPSLPWVNRRLRALGGPPVVAIVHHLLSDEPRSRLLNRLLALPERCYLTSVDGFVFNSRTTRHQVEVMVGKGRREVIAYPAADHLGCSPSLTTITLRAKRSGPLRLLFVGALIPRKGLHQLIRALAGMGPDVCRLTVVGDPGVDPSYARQAREMVDRLAMAPAVQFLGPCRQEELPGIIAEHHLFCMPYAYEGFGIAILEAMALGLPAVGCQQGAARETINHGTNGFLLAPDDQVGLAGLITQLHQDRWRLATLSHAALQTFSLRPRWQEMAADINSFIHELVAHHPGGRAGLFPVSPDAVTMGQEHG
jgi:glycosyltransferase involved in cell wall biosynthesis